MILKRTITTHLPPWQLSRHGHAHISKILHSKPLEKYILTKRKSQIIFTHTQHHFSPQVRILGWQRMDVEGNLIEAIFANLGNAFT